MVVRIRWFDGFEKEIEVTEYRCGNSNYWIRKKSDGKGMWFPKNEIRYFEEVE